MWVIRDLSGVGMGFKLVLMTVAIAGLASGCTSAVFSTNSSKAMFHPDGSYILTSEESSLDCQRLSNRAIWHVGRLNWYADIETLDKTTPPKTMISMLKKAFGSGDQVSENIKQINNHLAQSQAFNKALKGRGCEPINIDERLSEHSHALLAT